MTHVVTSTYRLGFHRGFRLVEALGLVSYLDQLGISTVYASPLFKARKGSTHGYDVTDPSRLNPEIGVTSDLSRLSEGLHSRGMGMILDIVPNHMAASFENRWWRDVLEHGEGSPYAPFFDIDWNPPQEALHHRISLPVLGAPYGRVLENGELTLNFDREGFAIHYWENRLPLEPFSLLPLIREVFDRYGVLGLKAGRGPASVGFDPEMLSFVAGEISPPSDPRKRRASIRKIKGILQKMWTVFKTSPDFETAVRETLSSYRGIRGVPSSWNRLDRLLSSQVYWLSHWKTVSRTLNYRRFFDVADLVGVRTEEPSVFFALHGLALDWYRKEWVDGFRVDHVDGLADPSGYLRTFSAELRQIRPLVDPPMIWVEKILSEEETVEPEWPVLGTTGYEFMNALNRIFVHPEGADRLSRWYVERIDPGASFADICYFQKKKICETLLGGELRRLTFMLEHLAQNSRHAREMPFRELQAGLVEVTACMPVYRTYASSEYFSEKDRTIIRKSLEEARRRHPTRRRGLYQFFETVLTMDFPEGISPAHRELWVGFVRRWQQFTGPVMAKGVEDTAFYLYAPLLSANEVGGDPVHLSTPESRFHSKNRMRRSDEPLALSATSTHDTKRSEDVRARINVLSEMSAEWCEKVEKWMRMNKKVRMKGPGGEAIPEPSLELLIYQTLVGGWPLFRKEEDLFRKRMADYLVKVVREQKRHSDWITPNLLYEEALQAFLWGILREDRPNPFLMDFRALLNRISTAGAQNSLSQLVLKLLSPGIPDCYQGSEVWDFSLVDPDNRRPVDFAHRQRLLLELKEKHRENPVKLWSDLLVGWKDGRIKLLVSHLLLDLRRRFPDLFLKGGYWSLPEEWESESAVLGFFRVREDQAVLVAVPRFSLSRLDGGAGLLCDPSRWGGRRLPLPRGVPQGEWIHAFSKKPVKTVPSLSGVDPSGERCVLMKDVFDESLLTVLLCNTGGR